MDRRVFFDKLHEDLALQVDLTTKQIQTIRSSVLGQGKTKQQVIDWSTYKSTLKKRNNSKTQSYNGRRTQSLGHYHKLINFLNNCDDSTFSLLTQRTQYDKTQ